MFRHKLFRCLELMSTYRRSHKCLNVIFLLLSSKIISKIKSFALKRFHRRIGLNWTFEGIALHVRVRSITQVSECYIFLLAFKIISKIKKFALKRFHCLLRIGLNLRGYCPSTIQYGRSHKCLNVIFLLLSSKMSKKISKIKKKLCSKKISLLY